jgi:hypothetical protein
MRLDGEPLISTIVRERRLDRAWIGLRLVAASLMLVVLDYVATVLVMQLVPKLVGPMNLPMMAVILNGAFYVTLAAAALVLFLVSGFSFTAMIWVVRHLGIDPGSLAQHLRTASYIAFLLFLTRVPQPGGDLKAAVRARRIAYGLAGVLVFTVGFQITGRRLVVAGGAGALITFLVVDVLAIGLGMILFARAAYLANDVRRGLAEVDVMPPEVLVTS